MTVNRVTADEAAARLAHFQHRVIQDALTEATETYWLRRAAQFAAVGNPRCDETAQACRNAAALMERYGLGEDQLLEIETVLT